MFRRKMPLLTLWTAVFCLGIQPAAHAQTADTTRISDVIYAKHGGVALTMDVFKPKKPNGIGVIWMVSGGWVSNHDSINADLAKVFTDRGQTVFQVVHGSQPKFTISEIVPDIHRAVRFIRTHAKDYKVDPNRLGISGGSAGGHLSLMIGAYGSPGKPDAKDEVDRASSEVEAVAVFFPPTDFMNYGKEGLQAISNPFLKGYWPAFGVTEQTPKDKLEEIGKSLSPIYGMTEKMPPTLIVHGDADMLVPIQQSQLAMAKLETLKVPHQLIVEPGKGHGWEPALMAKDLVKFADWFEKYLAKK